MTKIKSLSLAFTIVLLVGCSSLNYHSGDDKPLVYPGIRADYLCIIHLPGKEPFSPVYITYSVIDFPFSFVVDTLYLPYDTYQVANPPRAVEQRSSGTNNVASQIQTNELWKPAMSPKQTERWNMLPGP